MNAGSHVHFRLLLGAALNTLAPVCLGVHTLLLLGNLLKWILKDIGMGFKHWEVGGCALILYRAWTKGREPSGNGEPQLIETLHPLGERCRKACCLGQGFPDYRGLWKPASQAGKQHSKTGSLGDGWSAVLRIIYWMPINQALCTRIL